MLQSQMWGRKVHIAVVIITLFSIALAAWDTLTKCPYWEYSAGAVITTLILWVLSIGMPGLFFTQVTVAFRERGIYHEHWLQKLLTGTGKFHPWEEFKGYKTDGNEVVLLRDFGEGVWGKIRAKFGGNFHLREKSGQVQFVVGQYLMYCLG